MNSPRVHLAFAAALGTLTIVPALRADEILLGRIPLSGVVVHGLSDCQVQYTMAGRLATRPVDRVILHLDAMPALQQAETAAAEQRLDEALTLLDEAMQQAAQPWHKTWVHYRRTRLLADAGRYTPACGSWATLLLTSVEPCWLDAMPTGKPDQPDEATASAALTQLRKALELAEPDSVQHEMIDLAMRTISSLQLSEHYRASPAAQPDDEPSPGAAPQQTPAQPDAEPDDQPDDAASEKAARPQPASAAADEIDALLDAGRMGDARRAIERRAADTKSYPIDRLLYQYGRVLAADREPRDAAVRFMQCAILYSESSLAAPSLFEAARLYAGPLDDRAAARRLLERAQATADAELHADLLEKIDTALAELSSRR